MADQTEKSRYTAEELAEFEVLINEKMAAAKKELEFYKDMLSRKSDNGTDHTLGNPKPLEDGADTAEKESINQLASRMVKYIKNLEDALVRIKNGTYGICTATGKLIGKERLRAVPHTTMSIDAKKAQNR